VKIECIKNKIKEPVSIIEKITGKNLALPILSAILLVVKNKILTLRATNLDLGIEIEIPVKTHSDGIAAVPGSIFNNLLSNLHDEIVVIESENENIILKTKNSSTVLKSYPYDDFPTLPAITKEESFVVQGKKFIEGLKSVWFSASYSDIKPEISSVYMFQDSNFLVFVSTDSFRLAEKKVNIQGKEKISSFLIPIKNISELIRIFNDTNENITISFNKNQVCFKSNGIYVVSRLVDGIFPDYKQIIPKDFVSEAIVLKQDFLNALKLTNLFSDKLNQIGIKINPSKKLFELHSKNPDIGENVVQIGAALSGNSLELNFNYKYIIECLQSIPKDSLSLQFGGENKPLVIQGVGDKFFTYLVMPLNQ